MSTELPTSQEPGCRPGRGGFADDLLRPAEVARRLGVSRAWIYKAAKVGWIPSIRLGSPDGPLRFVAGDVDDWVIRARAAWRPGQTSVATVGRVRDEFDEVAA